MLRIAVCDDEEKSLEEILSLLRAYTEQLHENPQISTYTNPNDLMDALEKGTGFDTFLLDVYMPGLKGIELAKSIRDFGIKAPVIFLTTSRKHALDAYAVDAMQYITKPIDKVKFFSALDSALQKAQDDRVSSITIQAGRTVIHFVPRDIIYCESHKNNQEIHTISRQGDTVLQEIYSARITSAQLFEKLSKFDCFVKIGSAYIVNLSYVKMVETNRLLLENGTAIPLPRGTYTDVKKKYLSYYYGGGGTCNMNQIVDLLIISVRQIAIFFLHGLFAIVSLTPKHSMKKIILIWGISVGAFILLTVIPFNMIDVPLRTFYNYFLAVIIYFIDVKLTFGDSLAKKIFVFSVSVSLTALVIVVSVVLLNLNLIESPAFATICGLLVYLIAELIYIFLLKSPLRRIHLEKESEWWFLTGVVIFYSLSLSAKVVLFDAFGERNVANLLMDLILAVILVIVLGFVFHMLVYMEKAKDLGLMEERSRLYEAQLMEMREAEQQTDYIRHDIRHHNMIIAEYAANRDYEGLTKYINAYEEEAEKRIFHRICENDTANSILSAYQRKARQSGIETAVSAHVSSNCPIHAIDLLSLIANVFDNAIIGCDESGKENPSIVFSIREEDGKLLLSCKNTCRSHIVFNEVGLPVSQGKRKHHGIGIKSIMAVVEKYGGITDFHTEDNTFICRVALSLRNL